MSEGGITCGDCNLPGPEWGSLNRGLLLCKDCCYIHRTLGPQFTRVKSLKHSQWHPTLKKLLYTLASGPANHVWEYTLLIEPSKADLNLKPTPNDPVETKRRKFITAKHIMCQFVHRQKSDSLSNELHSTVRTADVGTSLRLLASGGDSNFFHPVVGTRPLHVAARSGQALQVELLFLHGAQTDGLDYLGQTPVEHALAAGHKDLALRLLELRYHLTDQLSFFVCSQMPDHSTSKHIIIPKETALVSHRKLQEQMLRGQQPRVLEQFASDVYDEVDRRQLESAMLGGTTGSEASKYSVAFLPVHSYFPSVRNQTRQKFARLTNEELGSLITLILLESKRRHCNTVTTEMDVDKDIFLHEDAFTSRSTLELAKNTESNSANNPPTVVEDDDYPLYDNVASDDDLILTEEQTLLSPQRSALEVSSISSSNVNPVSSCDSSEEDNRLSAKLTEYEAKIQELMESKEEMKSEILVLQQVVEGVIEENLELRKVVGHYRSEQTTCAQLIPNLLLNGHNGINFSSSEISTKSRPPRPVSMCDAKVEKLEGLGTRANSTELFLRKKQGYHVETVNERVQETTRKVVEFIKVIIEQANGNDILGIQVTSTKIYDETQRMASSLLQEIEEKEMKARLKRVLFAVLHMKAEITLVTNHTNSLQSQIKSEDSLLSPDYLVQKVKEICFDVGAAMKQLVSITVLQH